MKLSVFTTDNAELKLAKTAVVAAKEYLDVLPVADSHGFHPGDVEADTIRLPRRKSEIIGILRNIIVRRSVCNCTIRCG